MNRTISKALERFFETYIDELIVDPEFSFTVVDVEHLSRAAVSGGKLESGWLVTIETNNRAILLGQFPPYRPGDYQGLYSNLLTGRAMQFLFSEFGCSDFVTLDVRSDVDQETEAEKFSRTIPRDTALDAGIISEGSPLHEKLLQYDLEMLRLEGGSFVSGPVLDAITAVEDTFQLLSIESVFDCFCGLGAVSTVARQRGATTIRALDIDATAAGHRFEATAEVDIVEDDVYQYAPTDHFDLFVADPYYMHVERFLREAFPRFASHASYALLNLGYVTDRAWCERQMQAIDEYVTECHELDTERHQFVLIELDN